MSGGGARTTFASLSFYGSCRTVSPPYGWLVPTEGLEPSTVRLKGGDDPNFTTAANAVGQEGIEPSSTA